MDIDLFLAIPIPALKRVLGFLRFPELVALGKAIPNVQQLCEEETRKIGREFGGKTAFSWNRCAPKELEEVMAERQKHCMVYYPKNNSIYCFGGEVIGNEDSIEDVHMREILQAPRHASFNDFWRLDLATLKWERVMVTTPPYPLPKCCASMVVWKDKIVLFGGFRPLPAGATVRTFGSNQSETHIYDPETNCWRFLTSPIPGPGLAGHTAVISGDLMIVYGGWTTADQRAMTAMIFVLNLKIEKWHSVSLHSRLAYRGPYELAMRDLEPGARFFPCMHPSKSKMVLIRDDLILITGEMMVYDYGSSLLVQFDPTDPERGEWKWKRIETIGRWWQPRTTIDGGEIHANATCSIPNIKFDRVTDIRNGLSIRLVSLGRLKGDNHILKNSLSLKYDQTQQRCQQMVRYVRELLEKEFEKRLETQEEMETSFTVQHEGTSCRLENCFLSNEVYQKLVNTKARIHTMDRCRVFVDSERSENWPGIQFDEVDLWELRIHLRVMVTQLHAKYYPGRVDESMCAHLPNRNRSIRRLAVYQAELKFDPENIFDSFEKIEWVPQPIQFRAAPETTDYSLVTAHQEIIMHGGCFEFNESMKRMGHTYVLTLAREAKLPVDLSSPSPSLYY